MFWDEVDARRNSALQTLHERVDGIDEQLRSSETALATSISQNRAGVDSMRTQGEALSQLFSDRMAAADERVRTAIDRVNDVVAQGITRVEFKTAMENHKGAVRTVCVSVCVSV